MESVNYDKIIDEINSVSYTEMKEMDKKEFKKKMKYVSTQFPGVFKHIQASTGPADFRLNTLVVMKMAEKIKLVQTGEMAKEKCDEEIGEILAKLYIYPKIKKGE